MSKNEQRIDNWCMRENFEPTLVLELTRVLLEHFRSGLKISDMFHPNLTEANLKKQKDTRRLHCVLAMEPPFTYILGEEYMKEIKRGDIYLADLGENIGSVQRGERPVIVVQNNKGNRYSPTITVIPITTKIHRSKGFPTHAILDHMGGLDEESASMAEQITTISRDKLVRYIGHLADKFMMSHIAKTLLIQLGLFTPAIGVKAMRGQVLKNQGLEPCSENEIGVKNYNNGVPIWHKASLTVEEAAEYSNIGVNRIRDLCKDPVTKFSFKVGKKVLIKRGAFDEYLRSVQLL